MNRRAFLSLIGASSLVYAKGFTPFSMLEYAEIPKILESGNKKNVVFDRNSISGASKLVEKFSQIKSVVGYVQFNLLGFDEMLKISKDYASVDKFTKEDLELFEKLFYREAKEYGFYGEKVLTSLTDEIKKEDTTYIDQTGHFLYKGKPVEMYKKISKDIGSSVVLTSGVRSVVKQMDLFLNKTLKSNGNLSIAAHSLAPAGYSFHGIGDFDVGKVGYGNKNFTSDFAKTDEYKKLIDSGYVQIRYPEDNPFGVRYEPWHIKVV